MPEPPAKPEPLVYSVVLTYNNFADTDECVASLVEQRFANQKIIVVDNHSTDSSLSQLRERWGDRVEFIDSGGNLGVPGGYSIGIAKAMANGAEYVSVFNNDVVVAPDFTSSLVEVFGADPKIGMAAPLTLYYSQPDRVWFAKVEFQSWFGLTRNLFRGRPLAEVALADGVQDSDYVLTHATMISRRALARAGPLDGRFFYGHDDVDFSLRLRTKGFRCVSVLRPLVRHKISVTAGFRGSGTLRPAAAYTYGLGSVLIGAKHFSGVKAPTFLLGLLTLRAPWALLQFALAGRAASMAAYLRGLGAGLRRYGVALFSGSEARGRD